MAKESDFDPRVARLLHLFTEFVHLAAAIGAPESEKPKKYYDRQEAAAYLTISPSSFDKARKIHKLRIDHIIGRRGLRFLESDLDELRAKISRKGN